MTWHFAARMTWRRAAGAGLALAVALMVGGVTALADRDDERAQGPQPRPAKPEAIAPAPSGDRDVTPGPRTLQPEALIPGRADDRDRSRQPRRPDPEKVVPERGDGRGSGGDGDEGSRPPTPQVLTPHLFSSLAMQGSGRASDGTHEYRFSLNLRRDAKDRARGTFEIERRPPLAGAPGQPFVLRDISLLDFRDDQDSAGPCFGVSKCRADWNTVELEGTGRVGRIDGYSVALAALDGGEPPSLDRLAVTVRNPDGGLVFQTELEVTSGQGLRADGYLPLPEPGGPVVLDSFADVAGTTLEAHAPDVAFVGGWDEVTFEGWRIETVDGRSVAANVIGTGEPFYATSDAGLINAEIETVLRWEEGEAGVVFRYADAGNHWEFLFDGGGRMELRKVVGATTTVVAARRFEWGDRGKTRVARVVLEGERIRALIDRREMFDLVDGDLHGFTRAGIYYRREPMALWDSFSVSSLGPFPAPVPTPAPPPALPESLVFDTFSEAAPVALTAHVPDKVAAGAWSAGAGGIGSGSWHVGPEALVETSGADRDLHAIIDAGAPDVDVRVDVLWNGGGAGLVFRYRDEGNWFKVWYDGHAELVAASFTSPPGGSPVFQELGRVAVEWAAGEVHRLRVRRNGDSIRIYGEADQVLMWRVVGGLAETTLVGVFARNTTSTAFDNFIVAASEPLHQPDPPPPTAGPTPTPVPEPPGVPADAAFFDSFTAYNGSDLAVHPPDADPLGLGWTLDGGWWQVYELGAREFRGSERDFRAVVETGAADSLIETSMTWRNGRAGVVFRYADEANWMMAWYDGRYLFLAADVGGTFRVLDRQEYRWREGATKDIQIAAVGRRGSVTVAGDTVFRFTEPELQRYTKAGLFYRAEVGTRFDNFTVTPGTPAAPAISALVPDTVLASSPGLDLVVLGENFTAASVVEVDGAPRGTTFVDPSQLIAVLSSGDLEVAGEVEIVVNNGAYGGASEPAVLTVENPVPAMAAPSLTRGLTDPDLSLSIAGAGFVPTSVVRLDGADRATTFISSAELVVTLLPTDVDDVGTATVTVFNPPPGGGESAPVLLVIENPAPSIASLSTVPAIVAAGDTGVILTLAGSGFTPDSVVSVNGVGRTPSSVDWYTIQVLLEPEDTAVAGTAPVTVANPPPGGGGSNTAWLKIAIVYDSFTGVDLTPLSSHSPDAAPAGSAWANITGAGKWRILNDAATEISGIDADTRIAIDAGVSDAEVGVDITRGSGGDIIGVTARTANDAQWIIWWFDGSWTLWAGRVPVPVGGGFILGAVYYPSWAVGDTHRMSIVADGASLSFLMDGQIRFSVTDSQNASNTKFGLFGRRVSTSNPSAWDDFTVVPLSAP